MKEQPTALLPVAWRHFLPLSRVFNISALRIPARPMYLSTHFICSENDTLKFGTAYTICTLEISQHIAYPYG